LQRGKGDGVRATVLEPVAGDTGEAGTDSQAEGQEGVALEGYGSPNRLLGDPVAQFISAGVRRSLRRLRGTQHAVRQINGPDARLPPVHLDREGGQGKGAERQ
jgi:transposase InsO family protein